MGCGLLQRGAARGAPKPQVLWILSSLDKVGSAHEGTGTTKNGPPKGANLHASAPYRDIPTAKGALVAASNKEASLSATIGKRKRCEAERQGCLRTEADFSWGSDRRGAASPGQSLKASGSMILQIEVSCDSFYEFALIRYFLK
jgi:hypothetical protein